MADRSRRLEVALFVLVLTVGAALRLAQLDQAPPGLTHDEADHGVDAAGVLEGRTPIYFTVGYGREPLYDYVTAAVMRITGPGFMAGRLTAAFFGLWLLVLTYAWVRLATQNRWLALATMAGLAVSFWGVSTSRQALRSITLPVLYMAAALAMRRGITIDEEAEPAGGASRLRAAIDQPVWFVLAGIFLGLSFYTYLAARLMWLVFPLFFIFLSLTQPGVIRRAWRGLIAMLAIGALIAAPLIHYLIRHPAAEVRLTQLSGPLTTLLSGNAVPLLTNIRAGLGMITVRGDDLWLYNIPGEPLLGPFNSLLFYLGISVAVMSIFYPYRPVRRGLRTFDDAFRVSSANMFMLLTLLVGLIPALLTGVGASNTRVIGMQPALYYFPALAVVWLAGWAQRQVGERGATAFWVAYGVLMVVVAALTVHDYFDRWNNARDVRVAYHTTMVETLHYLDAHPGIGPDVAISTITPGRFHDPAIARMVLRRTDLRLRWFDGRSALVVPANETGTWFFSTVAPLDPALDAWLQAEKVDRIQLRPDDFNPRVQVLSGSSGPLTLANSVEPVAAGQALQLLGYQIIPVESLKPGDAITVLTLWQVINRVDAEIVLFTHVLDPSPRVVAQQDLLSYPATSWHPGDRFIQMHRLTLPADLADRSLTVAIGAYMLPAVTRLQLTDAQGEARGDSLVIGTLEIAAP